MGCQTMGTVTYPDPKVVAELTERFVPVKLESAKNPEVSRKMNVRWLPGLVVCDADERPAHVQVGFLPPADFLDEVTFGAAIVAMGEKRYDDADAGFARVADRGGERAPDAAYWRGISAYRRSKDVADYRKHWSVLLEKWPASQTARKVKPILERPA